LQEPLLWIVGFPFYLAKRSEYKQINSSGGSSKQTDTDYMTKLEKLGEMKEKGILTEEEFNQQKQALLK